MVEKQNHLSKPIGREELDQIHCAFFFLDTRRITRLMQTTVDNADCCLPWVMSITSVSSTASKSVLTSIRIIAVTITIFVATIVVGVGVGVLLGYNTT